MKNTKRGAYDPAKIEKKWQKKWATEKIYKSTEKGDKFYVLDMFPYPSGEGLHVGHPKGYIATDIISRFQRMHGKSVLHPMGFDAFGLPAENYAIKTKTNPADAVKKNVARYKEQLEILGFDYDWSREVNTTDPAYYKWTQWIFLELYKKGLAYESYEPINWCPVDKTGLANEDVEDGRCERCGAIVEKRPMRQWVLKITDYADRLLKDLDANGMSQVPLFVAKEGNDAVKKDMPFSERNVVMCVIKHWSEDKYLCLKWKKLSWNGFVLGGIEGNEKASDAALREISEETGYKNIRFVKELGHVDSQFYQAVKKVNRFAHFTAVYLELENGEQQDTKQEEKDLHDVIWVEKDKVRDFINRDDLKYAWDLYTGAKKQEIKPLLDWPNSIKEAQRNWIGKSEGAKLKFKIADSDKEIEVFTTRPDTLFGVTYVVLAPEHTFVQELLGSVENKSEVETYITEAKVISTIERTDAKKEKTGVQLKGVSVINPATNEKVPVWIADYVLADYGTGAVMAVPAHDERDFAFAKKYGLPVKQVIIPEFGVKRDNEQFADGGCSIVFDPVAQRYATLRNEKGFLVLPSGGMKPGEDPKTTVLRETEEETGLYDFKSIESLGEVNAHYHHHTKNLDRVAHATCLLIVANSTKTKATKLEDHEKEMVLEWITPDEAIANWQSREDKGAEHWIYLMTQGVGRLIELGIDTTSDKRRYKMSANTNSGIVTNSGPFTGKDSESVKKSITESVGGRWVSTYKLRDWVFSRQRYWGEPIPLVHCETCGVVAVPEKELPVKLPKVKSYEPTGTGESPLADIHKWVNVKCPKCKKPAKRETNTMPQWAGSSWYYLRYMDPKNKSVLVDPKKEKHWAPVDMYVGGAEHATRHLIYARFWHKFLYDIGTVSTIEPFIKLQHVGLIMGEDGRKMSKRFGNVVNPDDVVKAYGADTVRLYEMFMGPFDQQIAWSTSSMVGTRRFIERVWKLADKVYKESQNASLDRVVHKAIKKVTADIGTMSFNTAISTLMIAVNELEKAESISRSQFEMLLKLLAPFAPHFTEELWKDLGNKASIHLAEWPIHDEALTVDTEANIIVQVNGKVRGSFKVPADASEAHIEKTAKELPEVKKWTEGKEIKKIIVIKGKLVSIVVA
jgi:leucyl-tRNA synthetase